MRLCTTRVQEAGSGARWGRFGWWDNSPGPVLLPQPTSPRIVTKVTKPPMKPFGRDGGEISLYTGAVTSKQLRVV